MLGRYSRRKEGVWTIVILANFFILALLLVSVLLYSNPSLGLRADSLIIPASILLLILSVWCIWSWGAVTESYFNPYVLFLVAAALFNGGHAFLEIFGLHGEFNDHGIMDGTFSSETTVAMLFLVTLSLTAFHTGGLLSVPATYKRTSFRNQDDVEGSVLTLKALRLVGWGLLAISLVPTFLFIRESVSAAYTLGYGGYLTREVPQGFSLAAVPKLLTFFFTTSAVIFLLAGSKNYRFNIAVSTFVILSYSSAFLFIGDRQRPAMLLISFVWVYHRCIRPVPKTLLLIFGGLALFLVFPLVASIRGVAGANRLSFAAFAETWSSQSPIVDSISEMGLTMSTVAHTMNVVPSVRGFDFGLSYLYSLVAVVPNLLWDINPAVNSALDDWLIQTVAPVLANRGQYSWGYSFIAEAYLNFGWFGAPVALGIMGFLLGKFVLWADKSADPVRIALVGAFMCFFLIYARGQSLEILRPIVWGAFMPYLSVRILELFMRPKPYSMNVRFQGARRPLPLGEKKSSP